jgi:hypothetical protein
MERRLDLDAKRRETAAGVLRRSSRAPHGAADLPGEQRVKQHVIHRIHQTSFASRSRKSVLLGQHVLQDSQKKDGDKLYQACWTSGFCEVKPAQHPI